MRAWSKFTRPFASKYYPRRVQGNKLNLHAQSYGRATCHNRAIIDSQARVLVHEYIKMNFLGRRRIYSFIYLFIFVQGFSSSSSSFSLFFFLRIIRTNGGELWISRILPNGVGTRSINPCEGQESQIK